MCTKPSPMTQRGVSLIELIIFIVIIGTALIGVISVMNLTSAHGTDPLIRKQALAIAESLLEEVELMPFTFCDPDDANAASATSATLGGAGCAATVEGPGAETIGAVTEDRYGGANTAAVNAYFDNVSDYGGATWGADGLTMNVANGGIKDITFPTNPAIAALNGYAARVTINQAGTALLGTLDNGTALRITVTVDGPGGAQVKLDGYRTRFSPRM